MKERIVHPGLPGLDRELQIALRGELAEGRVGLARDVDLEADLFQLALDPHRGLLVRLPADAHGEIARDERGDARFLHQLPGLVEVELLRRALSFMAPRERT